MVAENVFVLLIKIDKFIAFVQGLKNHAVTMFEVGKLTDESMDSFLVELGKVNFYQLYYYAVLILMLCLNYVYCLF